MGQSSEYDTKTLFSLNHLETLLCCMPSLLFVSRYTTSVPPEFSKPSFYKSRANIHHAGNNRWPLPLKKTMSTPLTPGSFKAAPHPATFHSTWYDPDSVHTTLCWTTKQTLNTASMLIFLHNQSKNLYQYLWDGQVHSEHLFLLLQPPGWIV